jgi:signal transduction histidine kinase
MPKDYWSKLLLILGGLLLIAAIGYLDFLTGYQVSLEALYLVPIVLAAWLGGVSLGIIFSVVAALVIAVGDLYRGTLYPHFLIPYWNLVIRSAGFLVSVYFIRLVRRDEKKTKELNEFIAHDLKTPLTNILFSLENLQLACSRKEVESEERFVRIGRASGQRMQMLIDSFLDISRLSQKKLPLVWSREKLGDLIQSSLDIVYGLAQMRQVRIEVANNSQRETVITDRLLLTRVLINLLSNALTASPLGSVVTVKTSELEDGGLSVSVSDQGRGIPGGEQHNLFNLLEQGRLRKLGVLTGSGLGLIFCQQAIGELGGQLWLESRPGEGTTVCFTLVEPKPR